MNTFTYFAYGSNMSERRLKTRVSSAKVVGTGVLKNYCLTFNKRSIDGSGKCTIECCKSDEVYGVLFEIDEYQKCCLDKVEGGYKSKCVKIEVLDSKCEKYKYGEILCCVKTYKATENPQSCLPYTWYKQHVLVGAIEQKLPPYYINYLIDFSSQKDCCKKREERNLSIYYC